MIPSQGACKLFLPWLTISPSEADPGGRPKPKKSRPESAVTDALKLKGKNVIVAIVAIGSGHLYGIYLENSRN